jgi:hypothetical protein
MTVRTVELTMKKQQLQAHRSPLDAAGRRRRTAVFFLAGLDGIRFSRLAGYPDSKGEKPMKFTRMLILCVAALTAVPAFAQSKSADTNMQILLDKVKADKKLVVAANMDLTDAEGKAFWPIYDAYQRDLQGLNERLAKTIIAYADAYNKNTLTDEQANSLANAVLSIDQDEVTMRKTYAARLNGVLPGKKVARYLQIENKIRAVIRYEIADSIPLIE